MPPVNSTMCEQQLLPACKAEVGENTNVWISGAAKSPEVNRKFVHHICEIHSPEVRFSMVTGYNIIWKTSVTCWHFEISTNILWMCWLHQVVQGIVFLSWKCIICICVMWKEHSLTLDGSSSSFKIQSAKVLLQKKPWEVNTRILFLLSWILF